KNLKRVASVFLQRVPENFSVNEFTTAVKALPGVTDAHHTHVWTVDGEHHVLTTHVMMKCGVSRDQILQTKERIRRLIAPDFEHVTVDVELEGEECIASGRGPGGGCDDDHRGYGHHH